MSNFADVMATIGADENNSVDETLDEGVDEVIEDDGVETDEGDNSEETDQEVSFDPTTITDPQLLAAYKAMQAGFTPKLQRAADLEKQYGGLEPVVVDAVRQYQTLLQSDPRAAAEFLGQQQQWLQQQYNLQQPTDPFAGVEPLTPTEEALLNVARDMWNRQQQYDQENQQLKFQRQQEVAERQFAQIESRYKAKVPLEEKQQVWAKMQQTGLNAEDAWKLMNFDKIAGKATLKTAQTAQQKKKSPPPPTNRQQRSAAPAGVAKGKGVSAHFDEAWNQFSRD